MTNVVTLKRETYTARRVSRYSACPVWRWAMPSRDAQVHVEQRVRVGALIEELEGLGVVAQGVAGGERGQRSSAARRV